MTNSTNKNPPPELILASYMMELAESAPLAQGCIDAALNPSAARGLLPPVGLQLTTLQMEFGWVMTSGKTLGVEAGIGIPGLPLNLSISALHTQVASKACRICFEVHQSPVSPASTTL